jgi:hypothetical protein
LWSWEWFVLRNDIHFWAKNAGGFVCGDFGHPCFWDKNGGGGEKKDKKRRKMTKKRQKNAQKGEKKLKKGKKSQKKTQKNTLFLNSDIGVKSSWLFCGPKFTFQNDGGLNVKMGKMGKIGREKGKEN